MTAPEAVPPALSLVIPAYNEGQRLGRSLEVVVDWLARTSLGPVELVLADDGSDDDTLVHMERFAADRPPCAVQVLRGLHRGKGATVSAGMLAARGRRVLFSDADLSTPLDESERLAAALDRGADLAIGSREQVGARREQEPLFRHLLGRGFNALVQALLIPGVRDTQCGFKMFRREAAQRVFSRLRRHGPAAPVIRGPMVTAFDVEVLHVARKLGLVVVEVGVRWVHARGSKVQPLRDAVRMFRDVAAVKLDDLRGRYEG